MWQTGKGSMIFETLKSEKGNINTCKSKRVECVLVENVKSSIYLVDH